MSLFIFLRFPRLCLKEVNVLWFLWTANSSQRCMFSLSFFLLLEFFSHSYKLKTDIHCDRWKMTQNTSKLTKCWSKARWRWFLKISDLCLCSKFWDQSTDISINKSTWNQFLSFSSPKVNQSKSTIIQAKRIFVQTRVLGPGPIAV